jgi:serine phosphatase RsbU (regulator of sigma subunit)
VKLSPEDIVMLFTDGLYEVQDRDDELYSQAMLVAGVQRRAQLPAPQLFDELLAEIRRFSGDIGFADDVCLVGIEYVGAAVAGSNSKASEPVAARAEQKH